MHIDVNRAAKAFASDRRWPEKTLVAWLWGVLVVTAPLLVGSELDYIRRVAHGEEDLPAWDDLTNKWVRGLLVILAGLLYSLPVLVVVACLAFSSLGLLGVAMAGEEGAIAWGLANAGAWCMIPVVLLAYGLGASVFLTAAMVDFAMTGDFGSFFAFGSIARRIGGGSGYLSAWGINVLIAVAAAVVANVVSATGVGVLLVPALWFFWRMVGGHVLGQWAAHAYGILPPSAAPIAPVPEACPAVPGDVATDDPAQGDPLQD